MTTKELVMKDRELKLNLAKEKISSLKSSVEHWERYWGLPDDKSRRDHAKSCLDSSSAELRRFEEMERKIERSVLDELEAELKEAQ